MRQMRQQEKWDWVSQLKPKAVRKVLWHATETKGHVQSAAILWILMERRCSGPRFTNKFHLWNYHFSKLKLVPLIKSQSQFSIPFSHSHSFFFPSLQEGGVQNHQTRLERVLIHSPTFFRPQVIGLFILKDFPQGRAHFSNFPKGKWVSSGSLWIRLRT